MMTKFAVVLKAGSSRLHLGMTGAKESMEVRHVKTVPVEVVPSETTVEPGAVLTTPGLYNAQTPGGSGGGTQDLILDVVDLWESLETQVEEAVDSGKGSLQLAARNGLEALEADYQREVTARAVVQDYLALKNEESDYSTVPEIADAHDIHERTLYRIISDRLTKEERILPDRIKEKTEVEA